MMPPREGPPMERRRSRLSRRQFVLSAAGLGLLAGCGRGQEAPAKVPKIGVLGDASTARWDAFQAGLRELGWVAGKNLAVEYRWDEGSTERSPALAAELVHLQVECIVAGPLRVA